MTPHTKPEVPANNANELGSFNGYLSVRFLLVCSLVVFIEWIIWPFAKRIVFRHSFALLATAVKGNTGAWTHGIATSLFGISLIFAPLLVGSLLFARMIERRVKQEQKRRDLEQAKLYARRNLMITDMAHDLRTPVMSIGGLAQALADGLVSNPADQERYLRSIQAKADRMGRLTDVLFDFTKLESENYALTRERCDLPQIVLSEAAASYTDAEEAGMTLEVEVPETPLPIYADAHQLGRVFANLITNAIRHNPAGTTIYVGLVHLAGAVAVVIGDTGIPITGDTDALFEPFSRGDMARNTNLNGSGLGLSIAKKIVDLHGYQIRLDQPYGWLSKAFVVTCTIED
ncbi:cell wall metabolism sensor histidine kinase WalK [uncultured Olegusella sp.]|uniref:sensor histidine kinase n=1 Tax=uncultured Olegusella sp. TaxID=1979846 RepID=UPI00263466EB|nr:HAMP domain-containing sensor histidine kinase [uncultured Olegusella sp.]